MSIIWSIILAAGESKRMGQAKMMLDINGKTMIERVLENVTSSQTDNIIIVLGAHAYLIMNIIKKYNVKYCFNEDYKSGMLSSVQCGFRNLPQDFEAAIVFQGDQPLIGTEVINELIETYKNSDKGIVVPAYKSKRGHPIIIDKKYKDEIDKIAPEEGLRSLSQKFPEDVLEVGINDSGILKDFDTYEDYINEFNQKQ